ncbi:MAG: ABC transporter permease [Alphaproteobacteria bacterium]|nr:ABC transporter permease [Alphaproteobacteria bacterium]MDA8008628.1 ABC transporter permease [Alphaproteobacteria bacterium]MDA8032245.1 ABC transporter permease [Alphaproteobacteria bacterium]
MAKMILRRLLLGAVTIGMVSLIIFGGVEMLPGDACTAFLEREAQGKLLENCRADFGLNRPAHHRYLAWVGGALRGDFGVTITGRETIASLVGERLLNTLLLTGCAMLAGIPAALFFGVLCALWRDRAFDLAVSSLAIFAMTIPEFVSATLLILVFSVWLGWIPGIVLTSADAPLWEFFPEILLPIMVLAMVMSAHILRTVRSSVIETLASEYVQMAVLKGVPHWRIVFRHVLPNALLPTINVVALTIAWLLGGVVVIETVFNYPGIGRMMIDSISDRDLPVTQTLALIVSSVYVLVNLFADVLSMLANPRLRTLKTRAA